MRAHLGERQFDGIEPVADAAGVALGEAVDAFEQVRAHVESGVLPDDGAQLVLFVEAQSVVDRPTAIPVEDHVAGLAIGVVGDDVEGREFGEPLVELGMVAQREVVVLFVVIDPPLE